MKKLILVGAGHAHARVLLELARHPSAEIELVLITPAALAPYSGMVPGWMAGHYDWEACCIDFAHLCRGAGARLQLGKVQRIDPDQRLLWLDSGQELTFDLLSLDIGSTSTAPESAALPVMPMRPLSELKERWEALHVALSSLPNGAAFTLLIVGGGAAGVETALAASHQLSQWAPHVAFNFVLASSSPSILPALARDARSAVAAHLDGKRIRVVDGFAATQIESTYVLGLDGRRLAADFVLWAGGARAHRLAAASSLACDAEGFIRVDQYLRSVSHPHVFAAGDCASMAQALPKAGVFAVRMGPILAHNLRAHLTQLPMQPYRPQRRYLILLGTGGEHAVGAWGRFAWQGKWVWRWKKRIDQRFLQQYQNPAD